MPQKEAQTLAVEVGKRLYEKDRAAWLSSEAVLERHGGKMAPGVQGWLVLDDGKQVVFYGGMRERTELSSVWM